MTTTPRPSPTVTKRSRRRPRHTRPNRPPRPYLLARYYDPTTGRFTATDPIVDTERPISLDRYGYGDASPVTLKDPTGLRPLECDQGADCSADSNGKWTVTNIPPPPPKPPASSQPAPGGGTAPKLTSAGAGAGTLSTPGFDDMYLRFGSPLQGPYEPGPCVKDNVMHFCLNEGRYEEAARATMSISGWRFKALIPLIDPDSLEIFKSKNPLDLNGSAFSFRSRDVEEQAVFLSYMATDDPNTNLLFVNVMERTNAEYQVRRDDLDPEYGGTAAGTWGPYGTFSGKYEQVHQTMGFAITNGMVVG